MNVTEEESKGINITVETVTAILLFSYWSLSYTVYILINHSKRSWAFLDRLKSLWLYHNQICMKNWHHCSTKNFIWHCQIKMKPNHIRWHVCWLIVSECGESRGTHKSLQDALRQDVFTESYFNSVHLNMLNYLWNALKNCRNNAYSELLAVLQTQFQ